MKKGEAINLLSDLALKEKLVKPSLVSIEHREPDTYQLKIKGNYDIGLIGKFMQKRNSVEEDKGKGILVIL